MKRTRKSEAAETKVRILRLGNGRWGKEVTEKPPESRKSVVGRLICVWAGRAEQ